MIHFVRNRRVHCSCQPLPGAFAVDGALCGRTAPFLDSGGQYLGAGQVGLAMFIKKLIDILGLGKRPLEPVGFARDLRDVHAKADDDRPCPDAGQQQPDHHRLDDDIGFQKQHEGRETAGCRSEGKLV